MLKEMIDKLRIKKKKLQAHQNNNYNEQPKEEKPVDIILEKQDSFYKIEIKDYISIGDYVNKTKSSEEYNILDMICLAVLWNSDKQKVNKGIYYVITIDDRIYNILFTEDTIEVDERTKIEIDEQTQKENITQERVITFYTKTNEYSYYSAKHEENGNTYYTKYYNKNRNFSFGMLDLSDEEACEEINSVISNLEVINNITSILNIELFKEYILKDLDTSSKTRKKSF